MDGEGYWRTPATSAESERIVGSAEPVGAAPGPSASGMGSRGACTIDLEGQLVGVAPPPVLAWLVGPDDWVVLLPPVSSGMAVRRAIAAPDVAAGHAHAQVHPSPAYPETVLASVTRGSDVGDGVEVRTCVRQVDPFWTRSMSEGEELVDGAYRSRSLADGSGHPLGRAGADVPDSEQPRTAGLIGQRAAAQGLPVGVEVCSCKRAVSEHEAVLVDGGAARQPL